MNDREHVCGSRCSAPRLTSPLSGLVPTLHSEGDQVWFEVKTIEELEREGGPLRDLDRRMTAIGCAVLEGNGYDKGGLES